MIGAGSVGFSTAIAKELIASPILKDSTFVLVDIDAERLAGAQERISAMSKNAGGALKVQATTDRREALADTDYVITSFAPKRVEFWIKDIEIAERHGVRLLQGENGGPAGQIHALRNITILMDIVRDMEELCPKAWLLNFTNPMSMLCTYLFKHTAIRSLGFCHQVHGSFGVIAEMLGMEPGDLQVISAGINHMNFLLDVRRKDSTESYLEEFLQQVRNSEYWRKNQKYIPEQAFTLEFLEAFGVYPIGYDSHICEYLPFFYPPETWEKKGYHHTMVNLKAMRKIEADVQHKQQATGTIDDVEIHRILGKGRFPFPKDPAGPYYKETPITVMESFISGTPQYLDSMVQMNHGCVSNLPADAIVDIPVLITGGDVHGVHVGELPFFAAELCRRQIAVHELVVQAAVTGDRKTLLESLCLDPFVRSLNTMKKMRDDYLKEYKKYLPQFS